MARSVDRAKASGYMTKAENSLRISKIALDEKAYDAAVMNAVHGAINSLDALTTFSVGKRASGMHTEVLSLIQGILPPKDYTDISKQFKSLLSLKNASEYQPDLMSLKDAQDSIKWAERIIAKAKSNL